MKTWRTILGAGADLAPGRGNRLGPGGRGLPGFRRREGFERRRPARRRGHDHQDRHRHRPDRVHRRRRRLRVSEPAGRPVQAEGRRCRGSTPTCRRASSCRSTPIPTIDVALAVGQRRRAGHGRRRASATVETRSTGVGQVIDNQQVTEIPLNGRQATELIFLSGLATSAPAGRPQHQQELSDRDDLGGRRPGQRHHLHHGRRHAQRSVQQPEPADAVSRRAAGVQGRDQLAAGALRPSRRLGGQPGDQVGHQRVPRRRCSSSSATTTSTRATSSRRRATA